MRSKAPVMALYSVCMPCGLHWDYDGKRTFGDFDTCPQCSNIADVWTESGIRNEQARRGEPFQKIQPQNSSEKRPR